MRQLLEAFSSSFLRSTDSNDADFQHTFRSAVLHRFLLLHWRLSHFYNRSSRIRTGKLKVSEALECADRGGNGSNKETMRGGDAATTA